MSLKIYRYAIYITSLILGHGNFTMAQTTPINETSLKILENRLQKNADSCLTVIKRTRPDNESLTGYYEYVQGTAFMLLGKVDSAQNTLQSAERKTKANARLQAGIYYNYGFIQTLKNNIKGAKSFYIKADHLARPLHDNRLYSHIVSELGGCYVALNMPDSALYFYKRALIYVKPSGDKQKIASAYNNIGIAYYMSGNFEKAIEWQITSIKAKENLGDTLSLATSLNNVGSMFIKLKKINEASRYLSRAYRLLNNESKISGFSALNLGTCFKIAGNLDSAIYYYNTALRIYTKLGLQSNIGKAYSNLGGIYEAKKDYPKSLQYMLKSLDISKKSTNDYEIAIRSRNVANVYLELNQLNNAKAYILAAKGIADTMKSTELSMEVYNTLSRYYEKNGDFNLALQTFKTYKKLNDSLFTENSQKTINEINTKYETEKKVQEINTLRNQKKFNELALNRKEISIYQQRLIIYFTITVIVLVSLAMYLFFKRYKLKQKNARELLARQKLELEQRMLLSQMNPHFIFNTLVAVQDYIGISETAKAQLFLSRFARLMRSILQNSRKQFIPVDEEIESLKWYIEIEKQRFGDKFEFELNHVVDEPEFIMMPPMMVQPFVENAIIHGFSNKTSGGLLKVTYHQNDATIHVAIEDNGKGRLPQTEETYKEKSHVSLGTKVVLERIQLLNDELNQHASCVYFDLNNNIGEPCGTRVELTLPLKNRE